MSVDESLSRRLLSDPDVRRWYTNLCEGSELTADIYLRRLDMICEVFGKSHHELAKLDSEQTFTSAGSAGFVFFTVQVRILSG